MTEKPNTVRTLICARDVSLALVTFTSFRRYCTEPIAFAFHDDGSLSRKDVDTLMAAFPDCMILRRERCDDEILPLLRNYRHCEAFRKDSPYALKLFDIPLISGDTTVCSDIDIAFFRRFRGLFSWPSSEEAGLFMKDIESYYSLSSRYMLSGEARIIRRLNCGFYQIREGFVDLDFVNWFLGKKEYQTQYALLEQTCWAALAARKRIMFWDPSQVAVVDPRGVCRIDRDLIIGHFSGPSRPLLARAIEENDRYYDRNEKNAGPENLRFVKAKMFTPLSVLGHQIKKKCGLLPHQNLGR